MDIWIVSSVKGTKNTTVNTLIYLVIGVHIPLGYTPSSQIAGSRCICIFILVCKASLFP